MYSQYMGGWSEMKTVLKEIAITRERQNATTSDLVTQLTIPDKLRNLNHDIEYQ